MPDRRSAPVWDAGLLARLPCGWGFGRETVLVRARRSPADEIGHRGEPVASVAEAGDDRGQGHRIL